MFSPSRGGDLWTPQQPQTAVPGTVTSLSYSLTLLAFGCLATANADEAAFFREYVEPLLQNHCYDCHSHDSGEASGGLVLDSKAGWSIGGDSGPAIVPTMLDKSLLWRVVNYREPKLEMPPDGKLPDSDLLLIKKWIESGAVDPREDGRIVERKTFDLDAGRQWWSFRPLDLKKSATESRHRDEHGSDIQSLRKQLTISNSRIDEFIDRGRIPGLPHRRLDGNHCVARTVIARSPSAQAVP